MVPNPPDTYQPFRKPLFVLYRRKLIIETMPVFVSVKHLDVPVAMRQKRKNPCS